jgi:hypothetical protein
MKLGTGNRHRIFIDKQCRVSAADLARVHTNFSMPLGPLENFFIHPPPYLVIQLVSRYDITKPTAHAIWTSVLVIHQQPVQPTR